MWNPVNRLGRFLFSKSLSKHGPAWTFARLCTSHHLQELQWIVVLVIGVWLVGIGLLVLESLTQSQGKLAANFAISFGGLTGAAVTALTWAYQTGSNRIGVVDMYACEISTICRVCLVVDFARASVRLPDATKRPATAALVDISPPPVPAARPDAFLKFVSEEHYTPVYDNSLRELQALDAIVVTKVTEFYTYRKTMIDYLRRLAVENPGTPVWRQTAVEMIYMQFLMYESARKAVEQLVEFEASQAESLVNIYCSEIVLYRFLCDEYQDPDSRGRHASGDYHFARLSLREQDYRINIERLLARTASETSDFWKKARATAVELRARFEEACPREPESVLPDAPDVAVQPGPRGEDQLIASNDTESAVESSAI
ncbi:MAG: hypothetical protein ABSF50_15305 [Burkholderiaceae bacterium]